MKTVKVKYADGSEIITSINGTNEEIKDYFSIGREFNIGTVEDNVQKVVGLQFSHKDLPTLGRDENGNLHNYALVSNRSNPDSLKVGCWLTQNVNPALIEPSEDYHLEKWDWENTKNGDFLAKRTSLYI